MAWLTLGGAAERLGVSTRQVQNLIAQGRLTQVARGLVDATSVDRLAVVRGQRHRRAWGEARAWGAVSLLSGGDAEWMGTTQRSRLRSGLPAMSAEELVERTRERASVARYRGHSSVLDHVRDALVTTADAGRRLGLAEAQRVDGYLAAEDLADVVERNGLVRDDDGAIALRATTMDLESVREITDRGLVLAALDHAESLDVRERRAGLDELQRALVKLRG